MFFSFNKFAAVKPAIPAPIIAIGFPVFIY
jgi:hypothetical protein